ncbi:hypothetical protein [Xenorhabdus eapokensis]|uniref:Uncharacterized protein n=1 Tax=Xenorhabdus eapokensis TaxID=1873482 RepID=A0A1Q5TN04_9GAMM|nr:hypothetical protein [Xenorhabdus eapokensis]OKP01600.1 hypothetical protein Xedl_02874 [Xenorhabdus eapokensis]
MMRNTQNARKKRYYTLDELKEIAEKRGYLLDFNLILEVFELKDKKCNSRWCWIVRPSNGNKVKRVRECTMREWNQLFAFNIARLEEEVKSTTTENSLKS